MFRILALLHALFCVATVVVTVRTATAWEFWVVGLAIASAFGAASVLMWLVARRFREGES